MLYEQIQGATCQETQLECARNCIFSGIEIQKFFRATLARAARNRVKYWREGAREARRLTLVPESPFGLRGDQKQLECARKLPSKSSWHVRWSWSIGTFQLFLPGNSRANSNCFLVVPVRVARPPDCWREAARFARRLTPVVNMVARCAR